MDPRWRDYEPPQSSSNHTQWLNCFNSTASLRQYTRAIYGTAEPPDDFDWTKLDAIYLQPKLLVGLNVSCFLNSEHVYRRNILGMVFLDYPERTRIPNGAAINRGGPRLDPSKPPPTHHWPWIEVMHSPGYGIASQGAGNLWMYIARGSGLWFHPGRVLALSDVWDLAVYLNETAIYHPRFVSTKTVLLRRATEKLQGVVDSISFSFHVDGGCCQRMVMRELVSLRNFSNHCPVSHSMRRGWPPDQLRHCNCTRGQGIC